MGITSATGGCHCLRRLVASHEPLRELSHLHLRQRSVSCKTTSHSINQTVCTQVIGDQTNMVVSITYFIIQVILKQLGFFLNSVKLYRQRPVFLLCEVDSRQIWMRLIVGWMKTCFYLRLATHQKYRQFKRCNVHRPNHNILYNLQDIFTWNIRSLVVF